MYFILIVIKKQANKQWFFFQFGKIQKLKCYHKDTQNLTEAKQSSKSQRHRLSENSQQSLCFVLARNYNGENKKKMFKSALCIGIKVHVSNIYQIQWQYDNDLIFFFNTFSHHFQWQQLAH